MARKLNVAVLMGGNSPEHDISILSGLEVVRHLNQKKYYVLPVLVSRNGITWQFQSREQFLLQHRTKKANKPFSGVKALITKDHLSFIKSKKVDLAFIAMHGSFGEDGKLQGFLEVLGLPYTGSNVLASAIGMDKLYSRKLFIQSGLLVPRYVAVKKGQSEKEVFKKLKSPVFVKPNNQGSSVGVTKVSAKKDLGRALNKVYKYSNTAIVEEFIDGTEITAGILGNENPKALPIVEIVPKKDFFDYEAKYNESLCDEIVPARINRSMSKKAQQFALNAYEAINCSGFGRVDMIIRKNKIYVLEVNTIPGLTSVSLLPKAAKAAGISYPQLLDKIIYFASYN